MTQVWKPWQMPLEGPPCLTCIFWRPQFRYVTLADGTEIYDGLVCCTVPDQMCHDFSCYRCREKRPVSQKERGV
jgi:hypothetical protein